MTRPRRRSDRTSTCFDEQSSENASFYFRHFKHHVGFSSPGTQTVMRYNPQTDCQSRSVAARTCTHTHRSNFARGSADLSSARMCLRDVGRGKKPFDSLRPPNQGSRKIQQKQKSKTTCSDEQQTQRLLACSPGKKDRGMEKKQRQQGSRQTLNQSVAKLRTSAERERSGALLGIDGV